MQICMLEPHCVRIWSWCGGNAGSENLRDKKQFAGQESVPQKQKCPANRAECGTRGVRQRVSGTRSCLPDKKVSLTLKGTPKNAFDGLAAKRRHRFHSKSQHLNEFMTHRGSLNFHRSLEKLWATDFQILVIAPMQLLGVEVVCPTPTISSNNTTTMCIDVRSMQTPLQ